MLIQDYLKVCMTYDPIKGTFIWNERPIDHFKDKRSQNKWNKARAGKRAGGNDRCGYQRIILNSKRYQAHRLAWLYVFGEHPEGQIDHINGLRSDNRIINLREVTQQENLKNIRRRDSNKSGHTGVCWSNCAKKWISYIDVNKKRKHLGTFADIEDAVAARVKASREFGFHDNHGRFNA